MLNLKKDIQKINLICANHKVDKLYLFGSATNSTFSKDSDIDLLVKFNKIDLKEYFLNYLAFKNELKEILKREIDLVEIQTLKNPILIRSIDRNKELIYG
jgi:predicted nucleotidyltransferase